MTPIERSYAGPRTFKDDPTGWRAVGRISFRSIRSSKEQINQEIKPSALAFPKVIFENNKPSNPHNRQRAGEIPAIRKRIREIEVDLHQFNQKRRQTPEEQRQAKVLKSELKPLKALLHN